MAMKRRAVVFCDRRAQAQDGRCSVVAWRTKPNERVAPTTIKENRHLTESRVPLNCSLLMLSSISSLLSFFLRGAMVAVGALRDGGGGSNSSGGGG